MIHRTETPQHKTSGPPIKLDRYSCAWFERGASRLKEILWIVTKCLFFLPPLPLPSSLRAALLRSFGAKIGKDPVIRSGVNISFPWRLELGDHVWIGEQVSILSLADVTIGNHVCISQQAYLCTGSHRFSSPTFDLSVRPITVHDHCWLAARSFLCPGVTIGTRSMIGAGVTVTHDVPPKVKLLPQQPVVSKIC